MLWICCFKRELSEVKYSESRYRELKKALEAPIFRGSKKQQKAAEKEFRRLTELRQKALPILQDIKFAEEALTYLSKSFEELAAANYWWQKDPGFAERTHAENLAFYARWLKFHGYMSYKEAIASLEDKLTNL